MESLYGADDYFQFVKPYQEAMDFLMVQIKVLNEDMRIIEKNTEIILFTIYNPE